jgi:hypothetical protein
MVDSPKLSSVELFVKFGCEGVRCFAWRRSCLFEVVELLGADSSCV